MPRMPFAEGSDAWREAAAVVGDGEHRPVGVVFESQLDRARLGVARDIGQRLLRDAVDDELLLGGERRGALQAPLDGDAGLVAERGGQRGERALEAELLERLGAQPASDPADLLGARGGRSRAARRAGRAASAGIAAARPSTCSITPVSVWPTSSCSSRATRRRSDSCSISALRALSRRSNSSRSSISLKARASAATSGSPVDLRPFAGRQRIVAAHRLGELIERAERRSQKDQVHGQQSEQADGQHAISLAATGTETRTGREDEPDERQRQHRGVGHEYPPEQRHRREHHAAAATSRTRTRRRRPLPNVIGIWSPRRAPSSACPTGEPRVTLSRAAVSDRSTSSYSEIRPARSSTRTTEPAPAPSLALVASSRSEGAWIHQRSRI